MLKRLAVVCLFAISACQAAGTSSGYADAAKVFRLVEFDGKKADFRADITFPRQGVIAGHGPCNSFGASQTAPYPWFKAGPIAATRRACADAKIEQAFFDALSEMSLAEFSGPVLILESENGRRMVFQAAE